MINNYLDILLFIFIINFIIRYIYNYYSKSVNILHITYDSIILSIIFYIIILILDKPYTNYDSIFIDILIYPFIILWLPIIYIFLKKKYILKIGGEVSTYYLLTEIVIIILTVYTSIKLSWYIEHL